MAFSDGEEQQQGPLLVQPNPQPQGIFRRRRRQLLGVAVSATALAALLNWRPSGHASFGDKRAIGRSAIQLNADKKASKVCTPEGGNCADTSCCLDGGDAGLQCFGKNEFYAICISNSTCQEGVHEGETEGSYDQYGSFQLDKWSCEKLGERSGKGCDSYSSKSKCPHASCEWFRTGQCVNKCSVFQSGASCPSTHCIWEGGKCKTDPCSKKFEEDCSSTKCCSSQRGAAGSQCFKKKKGWSACLDVCDRNTTQKEWDCKTLGEPAKFPAKCSWAGKDCSQTTCCGNQGFSCVKKDDIFTGCVLTDKITTWDTKYIPLPDGWEGTVLGKWQTQYEVGAAAEDAGVAGVSLFCFMAVLPDSEEVKLRDVHKKNNQSIFACNDSVIFDSWVSAAEGWDTGEATLANTAVFFKVWDQVRENGRYRLYDWTVKVDADAAFLPDRLRSHLWALRPPANTPIYLKNTDLDEGLSNGQFLGAIEVFSRLAVQMYFDNAEDCHKFLGDDSGEDGYFKGCMDGLGIGYMHDGEILKPDFAAAYCDHESKACFHPLKTADVMQSCYDLINGKKMDWSKNVAASSGF